MNVDLFRHGHIYMAVSQQLPPAKELQLRADGGIKSCIVLVVIKNPITFVPNLIHV